MISVVGLGNAASEIAELFKKEPQYKVFQLSSNLGNLKSFKEPEEYEKNIPDLKEFFEDIDEEVQFFIVGSSMSSNYALGVLEQIKDKKINLFYIKPDTDLLAGVPKLVEKAAFGVLQQYARSGLLNSITIISNESIEKIIGNVPIKKYYKTCSN